MGMLTVSQIAAIIMLLSAFGVDSIITADVQRILEGRPTITSSATTTMTQAQPPASAPTNGAPAPTGNEGVGASAPEAPASKARIDIISPIPGLELNRKYTTSPELDHDGKGNPMNAIAVGAVLYGEDGEPTRTAVAAITIKTPTTEKTISVQGTGAMVPIYPNGQKRVVPVYIFHYEFKTAGEHVITFSSGGVSRSVAVQVGE